MKQETYAWCNNKKSFNQNFYKYIVELMSKKCTSYIKMILKKMVAIKYITKILKKPLYEMSQSNFNDK